MTQSPKQRFQLAQGSIAAHQSMVKSLAFEAGTDAAMNEYTDQLSRLRSGDMNAAATAGFKLAGAIEFLTVLKELADKPPKPQAPVKDNLDHNQ